jgi:hypothetical protein
MAYYPVTNYLYIYVVYVPFCTAQCYTVLYVDGGYIICMLGMDLFRVYTHASRARASSGGGGRSARDLASSHVLSACAGPQMRWVWRSGPHCTGTLARRRCPEALHSAVLDDSLAEDVALELMRLGDEVRRRRAARRAAPVLCEKLLTCGEHRLRLLGELLLHLSRNLGL